ncbi:uncharacterized protein [Leptinotarsa decemlineata]|uniref:uncharacterized protein n=1 Tax=Leptinotarsa decemlineata TaxID=7539 RepID=UPI003D3063AB
MSGQTYLSGAAKRRKAAEEKLSIAKLPKLTQYLSSTTAQSPPPVAEKDGTPSTSADTAVPEIRPPSCEESQQPPTEGLLETHQTPKHVSNDPANWLQFTEDDRAIWISKVPEFFQNRNGDFFDSARSYTEHDGKVKLRCLNPSVFSRKLQNGETVDRS